MEQDEKPMGYVNPRVALNNIEAFILTSPARSQYDKDQRDLALSMVRYIRNWGCDPIRKVE